MRFRILSGRIALVSAGILCGLRCFGGGAVTGISLNPPVWVIETNTTFRLTASVMPPDADNTAVSFSSAAPEIASVSADGTVTGVANGTAAITVTTVDGGHTATCEVTVYDGNHVPFYESFGDPDFPGWERSEGTPSRKEGGAHAGKYSYEINEKKDRIFKRFDRPQYQVVTIWLYDSGVNGKNAIASATAVETSSDYADGLGIHMNDNTYYKKKPWDASGVRRSKGWHELKWDYSSGTNCIKYIDGQEVMRQEGVHGFNRLWIGCGWDKGAGSGFLFDDIKVGDAPVIPRVEVSVSPAAIEMGEGGREKITASYSVYPDMEFGLGWSSSDPAVASVSEEGVVTAEGVGDAEVSFSVTGALASAAGVCRVHVAAAVPAVDPAGAYTWAGGASGAWDLDAANTAWQPEGLTEQAAFTNGATAILGSGAALTVAEGVAPGPVLVSSDEDVSLSGAKLGGSACVVKGGAGTLTIGGGGFSGQPVYVTNGVLKIGADAASDALGGPDSAVTVSGDGTLDIAYAGGGDQFQAARSRITHDKLIRIQGAGFNGQGALVNSGSRSLAAFSTLRLTGDATVNGKNRMDLRTYSLEGGARPGRATLYGPTNATLTVTGENPGDGSLFSLVNADAAVGRIDVVPGGCLNVEGDTALDVPGGINLYGGSVLRLWDTPAGFGTELFFREGEGRLLGGNGSNRRDVASKITVAAGAAMVQDADDKAQSNIRYSGGIVGEGAVKALAGGARFCGDLRTGLTVGGAAGKTPDVYLGDKATDMRGRATPRSVSLLSGEFALAPSCETVYSNLTVTGAGRFFPNYSDKKSPPAASILKEVTVNVANLALGSAASHGYAVAESGTVVNVSQDFRQGYSGTDSHGSSFEIRKGASVTVGGTLFIGRNPNTAADAHELRVSGGELNVPNAPIIVAHDNYHGRLFLDGGVINATGIALRPNCEGTALNAQRAGSEVFAMNGGVLNLGASGFSTMEGAASSDQICLGGGVLNSLADWGVKPYQRADFGRLDGRGGSFTLNLAGRTATFPTALRGSSAVLLEGGGAFLADSGSQGSVTGPWTVRNAGTNILANAAAFAGGLSLGEGIEAEVAIESPGRYVNLEVFWGGNGTLCGEFFNNPPQTGERFSPRIRDLLVPGGKPEQTALSYSGEFEVRAEDAGPFTFAVSCGDAAALFIDGQRVCGHDASGAVGTGTNTLQAGWHAFRLTAKNAAAGGGVINEAWKAAGMAAGWKKGENPSEDDPAAFTPFDTDQLPMRPAEAAAAVRHRRRSGMANADAWDTRTDFTSSVVKNGMQEIHNKGWGEGKGSLNEFEGLFLVEAGQAGEWTFSGKYDDRIGLWIDGDPVFKTASYQDTQSGTVALAAGPHRFRVRVLDYGGEIANGGNPVLTAQVNGAAAVPFDERNFSFATFRYGVIDGALELAAGARLSNRAETPCRVTGVLRGTGALKGPFRLDGAVWEVSCAADARQAAAVVFEEPFADALADAGKIRVAFGAAPLRGRYVISPALGLPADPDALAAKVEVSVPGGTDDRIVPKIDGNGNLVLVNFDRLGTAIILR